MGRKETFTKDNPAYPGMIGLLSAVTATGCTCSRCERLRSYIPKSVDTTGLKEKTHQMYEQTVETRKASKRRNSKRASQKAKNITTTSESTNQ